jgi:NAD(P)-dependent dehydrogenase (short-subunit alcohol dehydrogenase family)
VSASGDAPLTGGSSQSATLPPNAERAVASGLLNGHHVLVTGAASGIGKAVAEICAAAGAAVTRADLTESDGILRCDVRNEADVAAIFDTAGETLTDVVHCAGIAISAPIADVSLELWHTILDTNLTGSFLVGRAVARSFTGPGTLTLIASAAGVKGFADWTAYVSSKFGVIGLMRSLALELAPRGIRVNAVCPGSVSTPMAEKTFEEQAARTNVPVSELRRLEGEHVPLGRMADPLEVAGVCCFLASDLAAYMVGAALFVDGGTLA